MTPADPLPHKVELSTFFEPFPFLKDILSRKKNI